MGRAYAVVGVVYNVKGRWWCIRGGSPRGNKVQKWLGPTEAVCRKLVGSIARAINLARSCFAEIVGEDKEIVEIDLSTAVFNKTLFLVAISEVTVQRNGPRRWGPLQR